MTHGRLEKIVKHGRLRKKSHIRRVEGIRACSEESKKQEKKCKDE